MLCTLAQWGHSGVSLESGELRAATAGDSVVAAEAEAFDLAFDLFPVLHSVTEGDGVAMLEVRTEFLVVERTGVGALLHTEYRGYQIVDNGVNNFFDGFFEEVSLDGTRPWK